MFFYLILFRINSIDGIDCNKATKRKLKFVCNLVSSFFKGVVDKKITPCYYWSSVEAALCLAI